MGKSALVAALRHDQKVRTDMRRPATTAHLHHIIIPKHTCPYELKALDLLKRKGFKVEDHLLTTRADTDAFKTREGVLTTPQVFIDVSAVNTNKTN